jgi:LCP family protein required for cell wall assembly
MNVISVDRATDTTSIIPIPRDLWVEGVPEVPQNMKINEAFRIGYYEAGFPFGGELASKAVSQVTGLPIDGWISLDFQGFHAMVDAVGGITLENPRAFSYTWTDDEWAAGIFHSSFAAGTLELDGELALDYARSRYADIPEEHGDFARLQRQQRVMQAIRDKVAGWQMVPRGLAALDALEGHLHTNLPVLDLAMLFGKLDADHRIELDELLQPTTNTLGQFIFVVAGASSSADYGPLHAYIEEQLSNPPAPSPSESSSEPPPG